METIGAKLELPGSTNQKEPNIPIKIGVKKYFINLLFTKLTKRKMIKNKVK